MNCNSSPRTRPVLIFPTRHMLGGFTLIELLVVIGIISVLVALVLPALAESRRHAQRLICLSNQHNLANAIQPYAIDHDNQIPFGPKAEPSSIADFYVVDGMTTSQLSLLSGGKPVGLGLLLNGYLDHTPLILFCPDTDQPFDAQRELDRVGTTQAVGGYFYRHGSNTLASASEPRDTWDDHINLDDLGVNRDGIRIRALVMDQQFLVSPPIPAFNVIPRTNHDRKTTNVLYADGSAATLDNHDDRYTADIGNAIYLGPETILSVLEEADQVE